jgi:hypothetical protein
MTRPPTINLDALVRRLCLDLNLLLSETGNPQSYCTGALGQAGRDVRFRDARLQKALTRPPDCQDTTFVVATLGIIAPLMVFDNIAEIVCDTHQINTNEWIVTALSDPQQSNRDSFQGRAVDRPRLHVIALE